MATRDLHTTDPIPPSRNRMMDRRSFIALAGTGGLAAPFFVAADIETTDPAAGLGAAAREYVWSGAVTPTAARVTTKTNRSPGMQVRVAYVETESNRPPEFSGPQTPATDAGSTATFDLVGLRPAAEYRYVVEVNGELVRSLQGRFRTFPEGSADFKVCFASCALTGSRSRVFHTIRRHRPAFFLHMGDFHYENIGEVNPSRRREAYARVHESPTQSTLYRNVPVAYMWDDHDFLGNDSGGESPACTDARDVYRQCVPHYSLALGERNVPIAQAFTCGRVRFVLTDLRSARDNRQKTTMGARQKQWFLNELLSASKTHGLIVWMSTLPWIGKANPKKVIDLWPGYPEERREIANFLKENGIRNLCIVSGDAHMLAIDDGTNSDYADGGGAPIPVFQAAALDQGGSIKGGPYSKGAYPGGGQFGLMTVRDDGKSIRVAWSGRNLADREIVGHSFTV